MKQKLTALSLHTVLNFRSQIAIPAQGMIEFRDALTDLIEEFGTEDGGFQVSVRDITNT